MTAAPQPPVSLRITAHETPYYTDPTDAHEFYAALGMLTVAWGRLEGHVIGNLLTIMNFSELAPRESLPFAWNDRLKLWTKGFSLVPALEPYRDRAVLFMTSIIEEVVDRNFVSHAVWDEFVPEATEPSIDAKNIKAGKSNRQQVDVGDVRVTLTMLRKALGSANQLNIELSEFTRLLSFLRPAPSVTARL